MAGPRFFLSPQDVRAYEADSWAAAQNNQIADDWASSWHQRLTAEAAPPVEPLPTAPQAVLPPVAPVAPPVTPEPVPPTAAPTLTPSSPPPTSYGAVPTTPERRPIQAPPAPSAPAPALSRPGPAPAAVTGKAADFTTRLSPLAAQVERETGIPQSVLLAIAANETGFGQAVAGNNLFGIKGSNPTTGANTGQVDTWEDYGQGRVNIKDTFRAYTDSLESMRDFAAFLRDNKRYAPALQAFAQDKNPLTLVRGIHAAGYATDPEWSNKISRIMGSQSGSTVSTQDPDKIAAMATGDWEVVARAQLGKPYIWGSAGGRSDFSDSSAGFDCSGFVSYVYGKGLNLSLPAFTGSIQKSTAAVSAEDARPGDIVMFNMNQGDPHLQHVGIYQGNGRMIHSTGGGVQEGAIWANPEFRRDPRVADKPGAVLNLTETAVNTAIAKPATDQEAARGEQARKAISPQAEETVTNPFGESFRQLGAIKDQVGGAIGSVLGGAGQVQSPDLGSPAANVAGFPIVAAGTLQSAIGTAAHGFGEVTEPARTALANSGAGQAVGEFFERTGGTSAERPSGGEWAGPITGSARLEAGTRVQIAEAEAEAGVPFSHYEEVMRRYQRGDLSLEPEARRLSEIFTRHTLGGAGQVFDAYGRASQEQKAVTETAGAVGQGIVSTALLPGGISKNAVGLAKAGLAMAADPAGAPFIGLGAVAQGAPTVARAAGEALENPAVQAALRARQRGEILPEFASGGLTRLLPDAATPPAPASRMFHGTGGDFPTPDPARFDTDGLFGPGYYLTTSADVAGGIIEDGGRVSGRAVGYAQKRGADLEPGVKELVSGPNVRAVDVPDNLSLLKIDEPLEAVNDTIQSILRQGGIPPSAQKAFLEQINADAAFTRDWTLKDLTGKKIYEALTAALEPTSRGALDVKERVVATLQRAGFDGIAYAGGKRIPMTAADGSAIEHSAVMIFGESLPKIRNAISGRQGGAVSARFASTVGGAAAGGAGGNATTPEDAGWPERIARTAGGAIAGGALGYGGARVLGRSGTHAVPPIGSASEGATAYNTLRNMYGKVRTATDNAALPVPEAARRDFVRAWTDRGIDLAEFGKDAARAAGRPLTADENAALIRRMDPSGAARDRIQNQLKPAIQAVGDDVEDLKVWLTAKDNIDVARAMGNADRSFSGGVTAAQSQAALDHMAAQLGPERMARIEQSGEQIVAYGRTLLQRKVDAGLISQELFDDLVTKYPNYSPTKILDYMKDPAGLPSGRKITVQSAGLARNTVEGTTRQREDPLASFVRLAYESEALSTKNLVAQAFIKESKLNPNASLMIREVADDVPTPNGYEKMKVFTDGVPQSYQIPTDIARAIKEEPISPIPIMTPLMNLFRMAATQKNPLFLAANALNDSVSYAVRSSSRLGGPQNIPKVAAELVRAYGDAFQGIFTSEFRGNTARFLKEGGSMGGLSSKGGGAPTGVGEGASFWQQVAAHARGEGTNDAQRIANELQRKNVFEIRSGHAIEDLKRLVVKGLTLDPISGIGERIELAPRVAAMRLAEKAGATTQEAVLAGRTVTIDFKVGGTWSKTLNQVIPFFNVATQAGATIPRTFIENPRGFLATALGTLAAPTVAFEAWNRSDSQRAKDYDDVPQYIKDGGLVFMLPTAAQTDERGNRKPQYLYIPTREFSPFVTLTRAAAGQVMGAEPRAWNELLVGTSKSISPVSGNSGADVFSTGVPLGVSTAVQLATDQDWFRDSKIISKSGDEQASAFSKAAAEALSKMGIAARPSAVEFAARDVGAGVGGMLLAGSDMVAGTARKDERIQSTPGVGGLVGRFVQDRTGERLNRALEQPVPVEIERALKAAGLSEPTIPYEISVRSPMTGSNSPPMELRQAERAEYQRLMAERLSERITPMLASANWGSRTIESRNKALEVQVKAAREYAESKVYGAMAPEDRQKRMAAGREAQKVKPKP